MPETISLIILICSAIVVDYVVMLSDTYADAGTNRLDKKVSHSHCVCARVCSTVYRDYISTSEWLYQLEY